MSSPVSCWGADDVIIIFFYTHTTYYHKTTLLPQASLSNNNFRLANDFKNKAVAVMTSIATPANDQNTIAMTKEQDCFLKAVETGDKKSVEEFLIAKTVPAHFQNPNNGTSALMSGKRMVTTNLSACLYGMVLHGTQLTSMEIALVTMLFRQVIGKWWINSCVLGFKQSFVCCFGRK